MPSMVRYRPTASDTAAKMAGLPRHQTILYRRQPGFGLSRVRGVIPEGQANRGRRDHGEDGKGEEGEKNPGMIMGY